MNKLKILDARIDAWMEARWPGSIRTLKVLLVLLVIVAGGLICGLVCLRAILKAKGYA